MRRLPRAVSRPPTRTSADVLSPGPLLEGEAWVHDVLGRSHVLVRAENVVRVVLSLESTQF
jgi:hypothetical protein